MKYLLLLLIFFLPYTASSQEEISTSDAISWINEKLLIYSYVPSDDGVQKVKYSEPNQMLYIFDGRGSKEKTYLVKKLIKIDFIKSFSIRREADFIAIDLIPKDDKICGVIGYNFLGDKFDRKYVNDYFERDPFSALDFESLPFISITLKPSAEYDQVPERIVSALVQILKYNGVELKKEIF